MKVPVTVKEQRCVCNGGTGPASRDFCSLAFVSPLNWFAHLAHLLVSVSFPVFFARCAPLSCRLSDAKEQRLSSEADLGGNLRPHWSRSNALWWAEECSTPRSWFSAPQDSMSLLIARCVFALISHRGLLPGRWDELYKPPSANEEVVSKQTGCALRNSSELKILSIIASINTMISS